MSRWLLVNLQSADEFHSHMLNRDTWSDEALKAIVRSSFVFWQKNKGTEEADKVCAFYKLNKLPVIMLIDPLTGTTNHLLFYG